MKKDAGVDVDVENDASFTDTNYWLRFCSSACCVTSLRKNKSPGKGMLIIKTDNR
jgi:hypothetical protein